MNTALLTSIVSSDSLPSIPVVAFKVLELCRQDDVDINDVVDIIEKDPALVAKMMKVANSSLFGMAKQISSLQQAMVVLGLRTVKIMALGFSLVDAMRAGHASGFDYARYWRRSLSTAAAARQLADLKKDMRRDEAFVGGLLCDVGMIAAQRQPDGIYKPVIDRYNSEGGGIHLIEQDVLGLTHAQISAMMLSKWSMPELLAHAVAAHHGEGYDQLEGRTKDMAGVLWAASEIAELFCGDTVPADLSDVRETAVRLTGVTDASLEEVMTALNDHVRETAELFKLDVGDELSYDAIREEAVSQIAQLSLSAEHDRAVAATREQEARSQLETLKERVDTDALTGIPNRGAFDNRIDTMVDEAARLQGDLGLIMLDIDHFKKLNDTHGHQAGDAALRLIGKCLNKIADRNHFVARYGGEEFAIVAGELTARQLRQLAEDIRKNISRIKFTHGQSELSVTASLGAAHVSFEEELVESSEIIARADECLYEAKRDGRNRVEITF